MVANETINKKMTEPFFSVIITTYNRATLLKRALDSLIIQTEKDWEAIIVDDGSIDNTTALIKPYLKNSSKLKYVYQKNAGYAMAKNTGIFLSKGKFVTFLDSDDEYSPTHLEERKVILKNNPGIEFLHGGVKVIGSQYVPDRFNENKMISLEECAIGGTFFIKREIAVSLHGFMNTPMGSDGDFFERISKKGIISMKTDIPTYIYHRESADSITNNVMKKKDF